MFTNVGIENITVMPASFALYFTKHPKGGFVETSFKFALMRLSIKAVVQKLGLFLSICGIATFSHAQSLLKNEKF